MQTLAGLSPPRPGLFSNVLPPTPPLSSMNDHYVPPPPPYELSLQHDQKVAEEVQALEVPKSNPVRDDECKDYKHSRDLPGETLRDLAAHGIHDILKHPPRSGSAGLRAPRPLPPSPAGTRSLGPRGQENKFRPAVEIKTYAARNELHERELHSPVPPPFSAIGPSLEEPSYLQSMLHPNTSVRSAPLQYHSQSSHDNLLRNHDNRRPASAYSSIAPDAETSFRRSSKLPSQSSSLSPPPSNSFRTRLSFNPSVAYSNSQASTRTTSSAQREVAASLYSSAVSSHLHPNSTMIPGSRQSYAPTRPALWNAETSHLDKTDVDVRSVRSYSSAPIHPSPSTTSLYPSRSNTTRGYEQRWATSESDITRDVYHGG